MPDNRGITVLTNRSCDSRRSCILPQQLLLPNHLYYLFFVFISFTFLDKEVRTITWLLKASAAVHNAWS